MESYKGALLSILIIVSIVALVPSFLYAGLSSTVTKSLNPSRNNNVSTVHLDPLRGVEVDISPSYQSAKPGTSLTYTVEITNTGDIEETYYSIVFDNLGWELAFGIKQVTISPLDWVFTTLEVTIPENALGGTDDNITVTMVSMDNTFSYSASCVANVTLVRGVAVSITPSYQETFPGRTLQYEVTISNTGNVDDNYNLTATDNEGWNLNLTSSIIVPAFENRITTLSVTIPENAENCTRDNVTVTATSQENAQISYSANCIAHAVLAEFTLNLVSGWNLVGFSLMRENATPSNTFTGLTYYIDYYIYSWTAPNGPYELLGPDTLLEDNNGYWIWINQNETVSESGVPPVSENIHLKNGWNLVHFPVIDNTTTSNKVFAPLNYYENYIVYWWTAPGGPYNVQDPGTALSDNLAYWVWINQNKTITVP